MNNKEYINGLVKAHVSDMEKRGYLNGTDGDVGSCSSFVCLEETGKNGGYDGDLIYTIYLTFSYIGDESDHNSVDNKVDFGSEKLIDLVRLKVDLVYDALKYVLIG